MIRNGLLHWGGGVVGVVSCGVVAGCFGMSAFGAAVVAWCAGILMGISTRGNAHVHVQR